LPSPTTTATGSTENNAEIFVTKTSFQKKLSNNIVSAVITEEEKPFSATFFGGSMFEIGLSEEALLEYIYGTSLDV